ncbi:hypothetical protein MKW92_004673 [Papaver armeniacum]|nr:hypothetical protein MKW92_004673 [Papaver armeniacum]
MCLRQKAHNNLSIHLSKGAGAVLASGKGSKKEGCTQKCCRSIVANTWIVNGFPQTKKLQDIIPVLCSYLIMKFKKQGAVAITVAATQEDDDDDVLENSKNKVQ